MRGDWPWPSRPPVDGLRSAKASGNARKVKVQAASLLCNGQQLCRNGTHLGSASAAGVLVPQPIFLLSHCGCTAESRGLVPALVQKCPKRKRAPACRVRRRAVVRVRGGRLPAAAAWLPSEAHRPGAQFARARAPLMRLWQASGTTEQSPTALVRSGVRAPSLATIEVTAGTLPSEQRIHGHRVRDSRGALRVRAEWGHPRSCRTTD